MQARTLPLAILVFGAIGLAQAQDGYYDDQSGRPMLGIEMSPVPLSVQAQEGLSVDQGILVRQVFPNSAARAMGIQPGDVILSINDSSIGSMTDLRTEIGAYNIGDPVQVVVSRKGAVVARDGLLQQWPDSVPFDPLDPDIEKRFRDWQQRRMDREQQEVAELAKQVDDLRKQQQDPQPGDQNRAITEAMSFLAFLPAWRLQIDWGVSEQDVAKTDGVAPAEQPIAAVVPSPSGEAWALSHSFDSSKPAAADVL